MLTGILRDLLKLNDETDGSPTWSGGFLEILYPVRMEAAHDGSCHGQDHTCTVDLNVHTGEAEAGSAIHA